MDTHSVMPKKLAQALMDASIQHFDVGGTATSSFSTGGPQVGGSQTNNSVIGNLTPQNQYSAAAPGITTQNLSGVINQGQDQQQQIYNQQQSLAQTLLNQSNGYGPNVAQNQLNQSTGTNVASQAALLAGQRGSSSNAGLAARNIAQQGASTQQQAAGQAATLGAQQQLAAQQSLSGVDSSLASENLQGQSINQGALAAQNSALTTGELGAQQINAGTSQSNTNATSGLLGGVVSGVGSAISSLLYKGGEVPQKFADGGIASFATPTNPNISINASAGVNPLDGIDKMLAAPPKAASNPLAGATNDISDASGIPGGNQWAGTDASLVPMAYDGGKIPHDFRSGGPVPGKASVPGKNDPRNDTVPAMLSPGEEVLPLSVTKAKDPEKKAVEFMKHLKSQKDDEKGPKGYGKVLQAKKSLADRVADLEKHMKRSS